MFFPVGGGGKLKQNLEGGSRCKSLGTSFLDSFRLKLLICFGIWTSRCLKHNADDESFWDFRFHGGEYEGVVSTSETLVNFYQTTWSNIPEWKFVLPASSLIRTTDLPNILLTWTLIRNKKSSAQYWYPILKIEANVILSLSSGSYIIGSVSYHVSDIFIRSKMESVRKE
jgi:hypothetical protein